MAAAPTSNTFINFFRVSHRMIFWHIVSAKAQTVT